MKAMVLIIVGCALFNNVVLSQFLGICSFLGVSKSMKAAASLGGAVIFVITISSAVASVIYDYVLTPLNIDYMKTIVFILVIAALVQIVEMFLKKASPTWYLPAADHHHLRGAWCGPYKCAGREWIH